MFVETLNSQATSAFQIPQRICQIATNSNFRYVSSNIDDTNAGIYRTSAARTRADNGKTGATVVSRE